MNRHVPNKNADLLKKTSLMGTEVEISKLEYKLHAVVPYAYMLIWHIKIKNK